MLRIGQYEVVSRLTNGAMGVAYQAREMRTGRTVTLKTLPAGLSAKPALLDRLRRAVRQASQLHHGNLVNVSELGEEHGTCFLVFDFVDGIDLADYSRRRGPLDPDDACQILLQAAMALEQVHGQDMVHGNITPGQFVLTRSDHQLAVKLANAGLGEFAAEIDADQSSAQRDAYLAPELAGGQKKASRSSDIYALGCTIYRLMSGTAFSAGGTPDLDELISLNPSVTPAHVAVLRQMLAVDPAERYTSATQLLEDLRQLQMPPFSEASLELVPQAKEAVDADFPRLESSILDADIEVITDHPEKIDQKEDSVAGPRPTNATRTVIGRQNRRRATEGLKADGAKPAVPIYVWIVAGLLVVGGIAAGIIVYVNMSEDETEPELPAGSPVASSSPSVPSPAGNSPRVGKSDAPRNAETAPKSPSNTPSPKDRVGHLVTEPAKQTWPRLYEPTVPVNWPEWQREFEAPWAGNPPIPPETPILRVSRMELADSPPTAGKQVTAFPSLATACAAAADGRLTIIEIQDNGPLFERPIAVTGKNLLIRAAEGCRPLIVWHIPKTAAIPKLPGLSPFFRPSDPRNTDNPKPKNGPAAFLSVAQGNLLLGDLDIVLSWPESTAESASLVRITNGDLLTWRCVFSATTRHRAAVTAVRFEGTEKGKKCRFSNCFGRGGNMTALDLRAPGAEVLFDNSLWVGSEQPLVRVETKKGAPATIRSVRSTLVSGDSLLQVRPDPAEPAKVSLRWLGWDDLIARAARESGGTLVDLPAQIDSSGMSWRAVNCLYAGWKTLLSGKTPVTAESSDAWRKLWGLHEGDVALLQAWAQLTNHEPAEASARDYLNDKPPFAFAATFGAGTLGCDVSTLPPIRDAWIDGTTDRYHLLSIGVLASDYAPVIPNPGDGKYHGERLDLNKVDLGAHLRNVQKSRVLGPRVVLHLFGSGQRKTSVIQIKNSSLILYFDPSTRGPNPLVLIPDYKTPPNQHAVIEIDSGELEIMGGEIRCADFRTALIPEYLIYVRAGNIRLHRTKLQGPLNQPPDSYWGLIRLDGSGFAHPDWVRGLTVNQSVLLTAKVAFHFAGAGVRMRLQESVIVAGMDALHFQPGANSPARLNIQCALDHMTVAAKRSVVYVEDTPHLPFAVQPVIVSSTANVFMNPFATTEGSKTPFPAGLVIYQGRAVPRGLLAWQGDRDVYDKRLQFYVLAAAADGTTPPFDQPQPVSFWTRFWGPLGDPRPVLDLPFRRTLDMNKLQLDHLALPSVKGLKEPLPGANLVQLGIVPK